MFDLATIDAHGVVGTNTPDVLAQTRADFGSALLLAAARRTMAGLAADNLIACLTEGRAITAVNHPLERRR